MMPSTIKGIYKNGQVILEETPEINGPAEVLVTFTGDVVLRKALNPLDITERIKELSLLQDGWLNGEGMAPKKEELQWFSNIFESCYDTALPLPYLYPAVNGGVQAEWVNGNYDVSLNVDLKNKKAFYQALNHTNDHVDEITLDLVKREDWQLLNTKLLTVLKA